MDKASPWRLLARRVVSEVVCVHFLSVTKYLLHTYYVLGGEKTATNNSRLSPLLLGYLQLSCRTGHEIIITPINI